MARSEVTLTDTWQKVADGPAVVTVKDGVGERLFVNDVDANDATAYATVTTDKTQIVQNETKDVWAKGEGIVILVDVEG